MTAREIATEAHAENSQTRADGRTPYIEHPARVVQLVEDWCAAGSTGIDFRQDQVERMRDAAWLHDVLEDTGVTSAELILRGIAPATVRLVELLTKNGSSRPELAEYYAAIAADDEACAIKAADRSANLEDALGEVRAGRAPERWRKYVERTRTELLPIYHSLPNLRAELESRLQTLEALLDDKPADPGLKG